MVVVVVVQYRRPRREERETNQQIRVLNLNRRPNINSSQACLLSSFNGRSSVARRERERERGVPHVPWRNRGNNLRRPTNVSL